jgi:hypothetical protein
MSMQLANLLQLLRDLAIPALLAIVYLMYLAMLRGRQ